MCLADISGIYFTTTAQHRSCGRTDLGIVLLKVSRGEFVQRKVIFFDKISSSYITVSSLQTV